MLRLLAALFALTTLGACAGGTCKLDDPDSCPAAQACEVVQGKEEPRCFAPLELRGKVFDLEGGAAVAAAQVSAIDVNGAAIGAIAQSDEAGAYSLRVPTTRADEKGTPIGVKLTLRASAKDFQTFPSGVRIALPIDTGAAAAEKEGEPFVLSGGQADLGLAKLAEAERGTPSISGTVEIAAGQKGALVVAEALGQQGRSAIAGADGAFTIFNVPAGAWTVRAFSRDVNYTPAAVTVEAGKDLAGVEVKRSDRPTGTVKGSADIVAANGETSVVLVVKSTFNANLVRGEVPPGLRTPAPGTAPDVSGAYELTGVPDGEYVVLAAYENDGLVRDPNTNTSGTELQYVTVTNGAASGEANFKVTGAVQLVSPGGGETLDETTATPSFIFKPYSSAKAYDLRVFDSFGNQVWEALALTLDGSGDLKVDYTGPALTPGGIYQWRAVAKGNAGQPISQTEDLRGVFRVK